MGCITWIAYQYLRCFLFFLILLFLMTNFLKIYHNNGHHCTSKFVYKRETSRKTLFSTKFSRTNTILHQTNPINFFHFRIKLHHSIPISNYKTNICNCKKNIYKSWQHGYNAGSSRPSIVSSINIYEPSIWRLAGEPFYFCLYPILDPPYFRHVTRIFVLRCVSKVYALVNWRSLCYQVDDEFTIEIL